MITSVPKKAPKNWANLKTYLVKLYGELGSPPVKLSKTLFYSWIPKVPGQLKLLLSALRDDSIDEKEKLYINNRIHQLEVII